ncbi:MAG: hypothetical protein JNL52_12505 [Flavobacteriales bacterium]|nr:hypothetical protein [Flavobacteriales bacterium]
MASLGRDIIKGLAIAMGAILLFFLVIGLFFYGLIGGFDRTYTPSEMVEAFDDHKQEINELISYFNNMVPQGKFVEIEFDDDDELTRFGFTPPCDTSQKWFLDWDVRVESSQMDSLMDCLGWDLNQVRELKKILDAADCIQIANHADGTHIGFKRSGMQMYSYYIFHPPVSDSLRTVYESYHTLLFANDTLAVEWAGGAIGLQTWPEKLWGDLK